MYKIIKEQIKKCIKEESTFPLQTATTENWNWIFLASTMTKPLSVVWKT